MRFRGLLVGLVVLAALGGAVWWSSERDKKEEDASKGTKDNPKLISIKEEDITRIEIRRRDAEPVVLQREKSGWTMTAPRPVRVDADSVNSVASAMAGLTWDRLVDEKPGDVTSFGLATPATQVTVTAKDGKKQTLQLGDEAPANAGVYAKLDGDPRVFSVTTSAKSSVDKTWRDLRDKRLITVDDTKLSRVTLAGKGPAIEFGKTGTNEWQIVQPKQLRADNLQVEEFLRKLKDAKMDASVTDEAEKKLGVDFATGARVGLVSLTDPSGTQTLEVRKHGEDFLAKSSVLENPTKVDKDLAGAFGKGLEDFRNKKLFDFGFSDPTKINITDGGKSYSFVKGGDKWWSNGKEMDSTSVQSLIDKLRDLSATKFPATGFTKQDLELVITSLDGKRVEKVVLSKGASSWFAKRENDAAIYEIENAKIQELQRAAADVKAPPPPPPAAGQQPPKK